MAVSSFEGDFTNFVIRHAGKPGHPLSNTRRFFACFRVHMASLWMTATIMLTGLNPRRLLDLVKPASKDLEFNLPEAGKIVAGR
jgi:hypothetical protein